MLESLRLPDEVEHVRTTPEFTAETVPAGLLTAHCVARGVWGYLRVIAGSVLFVLEATGEDRRLAAGEGQVIEPETLHHIDPGPDAVFQVEFYE